MHPLQGHYDELERALKELLQKHRSTLSAENVAWVQEMLDHGEYGLAFEGLRDGLGERVGEDRAVLDALALKMGIEGGESEPELHQRALTMPEGPDALTLWIELGARGNPEAPDRLRRYAGSGDPQLRVPAHEALMDLGLSHEDPMP